MSDAREALARLVRTLDAKSAEDQGRLGRYWDRGLADGDVQEDVYRRTDAILAEFDVTERGVHNHDIDPACPETRLPDGSLRGECTTNAAPPTVKPSVEDVARAMHAEVCCPCDETGCDIEYVPEMRYARAVLALLPGRTEAEVKAEALREAAPGCNCEDDYARLNDRADRIEKEADRG